MWERYEQIKMRRVEEVLVDAKITLGRAEKKAGMRPGSSDQMDYRLKGSGRAEGESPVEYHRRMNRERMRTRRAEVRRTNAGQLADTERTPEQAAPRQAKATRDAV